MNEILKELITNLLILLVVALIHELGHAFGFYIANKSFVKIYPKWYGFDCGNKEDNRNLKIKHKLLVTWLGILTGLIPLFILVGNDIIWFFTYLLICFADIIVLYSLYTSFKRKDYEKNLKDFKFITKYKGKVFSVE